MKISQREMILGVATLAASLAGLTWYIADGNVDEWKSKANEMQKLEQQISLHQNAIKMQENWMDELTALQQDLRTFDPGERSVAPELMKTIKAVSSKYGLDITRSQPYNEKPTGDLYEMGINCTWEGSLDAMVHFLTELQQQGVRYDVRQLNVTPVGKDTGKLKGNMVIHCVYTRKAGPATEQE
jgi:Tfp pilus assembly protein PilO